MIEKKKVIVAHPGKQHSFETAVGMYKDGLLLKYITTVYDSPGSLTRKLNKFVLKGKDLSKAKSRRCERLPDSVVLQKCEIRALVALLFLRIPKFINIYRRYVQWINKCFGIKVAKYAIQSKAEVVIMYDTTSTYCFEYLAKHAPNIIRVLDMTIATREYARNIYDKEREMSGSDEIYFENLYIWDNSVINIYRREIELADYFLSSSEFVKKSIEYFNISSDRILVAPYGVDTNKFLPENKPKINDNDPIHLLFVGQINSRKGIQHLLRVVNEFSEKEVDLTVVGGFNPNSNLYMQYKNVQNIHFVGFKNGKELVKIYNNADAFVLPSLCEGMALVGFEAMSMKLPILCSNYSGINDLVEQYENGIVFDAGNDAELKTAIEWLCKHRNNIRDMGDKARIVAEKYTWENYHKNVASLIRRLGDK